MSDSQTPHNPDPRRPDLTDPSQGSTGGGNPPQAQPDPNQSWGGSSYGQTPYNQPPSGQPYGGQPQYGQPPYQQPQYGQPEYGQQGYPQPGAYQGYQQFPQQPGYPGYSQPPMAPQQPVAPPKSIRTAVSLMYAGAALSLLSVLLSFGMRDQVRDMMLQSGEGQLTADQVDGMMGLIMGGVAFFGLIGVALWVFNAVMNKKGKMWARMMSTVLGIIGLLFSLTSVFGGNAPGAMRGSSLIQAALPCIILYFLWRPESTQFYEANSRPQYQQRPY